MLKIKKCLILLALLFCTCHSPAQRKTTVDIVLTRLDTIRQSKSAARHFAEIYFRVSLQSAHFYATTDTIIQHLIQRMKLRFADLFFHSVTAYENNLPLPEEWEVYYKADSNASFMQYILLGVNAHINGDIWRGLTTEFQQDELERIRPYYFSYYTQLLKEYQAIYEQALQCCPRIRLIHQLSLGTDRYYGKIMLKRWLKRQMRLAELYFTNKSSFEKKQGRLQQKMNRLNNLIKNNT